MTDQRKAKEIVKEEFSTHLNAVLLDIDNLKWNDLLVEISDLKQHIEEKVVSLEHILDLEEAWKVVKDTMMCDIKLIQAERTDDGDWLISYSEKPDVTLVKVKQDGTVSMVNEISS